MEREIEPSGGETGEERAKMNYAAIDEMIGAICDAIDHPGRAFCGELLCLRYEGHPGDHFPTRNEVWP